jgi:hypothetical protein
MATARAESSHFPVVPDISDPDLLVEEDAAAPPVAQAAATASAPPAKAEPVASSESSWFSLGGLAIVLVILLIGVAVIGWFFTRSEGAKSKPAVKKELANFAQSAGEEFGDLIARRRAARRQRSDAADSGAPPDAPASEDVEAPSEPVVVDGSDDNVAVDVAPEEKIGETPPPHTAEVPPPVAVAAPAFMAPPTAAAPPPVAAPAGDAFPHVTKVTFAADDVAIDGTSAAFYARLASGDETPIEPAADSSYSVAADDVATDGTAAPEESARAMMHARVIDDTDAAFYARLASGDETPAADSSYSAPPAPGQRGTPTSMVPAMVL